jgi:4-coumarate--CoA ligase
VEHSRESLAQETAFLAETFADRHRVLSTVPSHHIYGFLFTVLLPARLGIPTRQIYWQELGGISRVAAAGDLVVSNPTLWRYLSRTVGSWPGGVSGTSSTAPLPAEVHAAVIASGIEGLWEIYGSTETAGVGLRDEPQAPFRLFPYLEAGDDGTLTRTLPDGRRASYRLQDTLEWADERHFRPAGRIDRVIQVGGENVHLDHVEDVLGAMPGVARAVVRPTEVDGELRLEAVLEAAPDPATPPSREAAEAYARAHLRPAERPVSLTVRAGSASLSEKRPPAPGL